MNILTFLYSLLLQYWSDVLLVVVVLIGLVVLYKRGHKDIVKSIISDLVVRAEKALGTKTGAIKYDQVISELYSKLPFIIRFVYSKLELNQLIDDKVKWLENKLKDPDVNLLSYAEETIVKATEAAPNTDETVVVSPKQVYVTLEGLPLIVDPAAVIPQ